MKVKTDKLVAEKEAKEVSEAIKDLDILTEKSKEENQNVKPQTLPIIITNKTAN